MDAVRRHRLALELGLLVLAAALAAVGVNASLRIALDDVSQARPVEPRWPATPDRPPIDAYAVIAARNFFDPGDAAARTSITGGLRLWGIGLFGGEARAVIEDVRTSHQDLYRVGDEVGGLRVATIDWDRVTLTNGRREETLDLSTPAADGSTAAPADREPAPAPAADATRIRRTGAHAFIVDRRELAGTVDNMSGLLTQLRAVAEVENGRAVGFRLFRIRDDSIFSKLGLRNGDVVQRVNGTAIGEPAALLGFLQRMRTEPRVAVDIVRSGTPQTLVYDLR